MACAMGYYLAPFGLESQPNCGLIPAVVSVMI